MARNYRHFVYDENQRFIYPTSDWGFKYLLGTESNKEILLGILKELLPELGIESLEYLPRDVTIPVGKMKDASFDVYCTLQDGSRAVIEMQNYARQAFLDRSLIYTSAAVLGHYVNSKTKGYKIGKTIFLAFIGDPIFKKIGRTPIRLSLCDIDEHETTIRNENLLQIFVELPKFEGCLDKIDESTPFVEKLAYVFMEMADCKEIPHNLSDPLLERLFKAADTSKMNMDMKEEYMKSILGEADYQNNLYDAREEGREEGFQIGLEEGREAGLIAGREAGLAEGREAGLIAGREAGLAEGREAGLAEGREAGLAEGQKKAMEEVKQKLSALGLDEDCIKSITGQ